MSPQVPDRQTVSRHPNENCLYNRNERFFRIAGAKKKRFFLAVVKNERIFAASKKMELK
jgi:hypothetical protein